MKSLALCLLLTACASTTVRGPNGLVLLRTQANAASLDFTSGSTHLAVVGLDHSSDTLAGGTAFSQGTNSVTGGVAGDIFAAGATNIFSKGVPTARAILPPVAAIGTQAASRPTVPKATPRPTAEQIWPDKKP